MRTVTEPTEGRLAARRTATASGDVWLRVRGVTKQYGGVRALRGVDLDLAANQVYGFIGPNGAGKSTLMKVLAGSVLPDAGEIVVDGDRVTMHHPSVARGHGLVLMPQEMTYLPDFTVADNILLGDEPTRFGLRSPRAGASRARAALALVGLDVNPSALASSLEPVEQRLLMLAKAIAQETRLLILDEPTAGLPPAMAKHVTDTVRRLCDHGLTIVYVSHHLAEVAALSDHVVCIREGRVATTISGTDITKDALIEAIVGADTPLSAAGPAKTIERHAESYAAELKLDEVTGARLRQVTLAARSGEVTGVTGLLGSGVAELVAIIAGNVRPLSGEIRLNGDVIRLRSPADALACGIGTVTGDRSRSALLSRSVRDNVSVTALRRWFGPFGLIRRAVERRNVAGALASLSVAGDPERPLGALSGGNQQRVLVSRLLAAELDVMVFDEPTVGVDVASRAQLWHELRTLAASRVVIVASGEPEEIVGVCDRVVCIRDGHVSGILEGEQITEHALAHATS